MVLKAEWSWYGFTGGWQNRFHALLSSAWKFSNLRTWPQTHSASLRGLLFTTSKVFLNRIYEGKLNSISKKEGKDQESIQSSTTPESLKYCRISRFFLDFRILDFYSLLLFTGLLNMQWIVKICRPPDKSAQWKIIFLISQPKTYVMGT